MVFMTLVSVLYRFAREISTPYMFLVCLGIPAQMAAALWADSPTFYSLVYTMSALVCLDVVSLFWSRFARLVMDPAFTRPLLAALLVMGLLVLGFGSSDLVLAGARRAWTRALRVLRHLSYQILYCYQ